mgnify:CR=1 FL=1
MSNRHAFLANVRAALGHDSATSCDDPTLFAAAETTPSSSLAGTALLDQLTAAGAAIQTPVIAVTDATAAAAIIARIAVDSRPEWGDDKQIVCWDHPLISAVPLETHLPPDEISMHRLDDTALQPEAQRRLSADAYIGITSALYCLADTATLVLSTAPGQPRAVSLLPSIHIALIHQNQIIPDLKSLYRLLDTGIRAGDDPLGISLTMITGPSKTADIEATMVHGAHGPRALHILVLTDRDNELLSV